MKNAVETKDTVKRENLVKFEVGKTYRCGNENGDEFDYKVVARTAQMITFENRFGEKMKRRNISVDEYGEYIRPTKGSYYLYASSVVDVEKEAAQYRVYRALNNVLCTYDMLKLKNDEIDAVIAQVGKMYEEALRNDIVTRELIGRGEIENYDYDSELWIANFLFSEESKKENDFDAKIASLIIAGAQLKESEYVYEHRANLHYLSVTRSGMKKIMEVLMGKDSSVLDVREDDGSNDDEEEKLTVDYNFDVEEEDDDDELIDPPEEEISTSDLEAELAAVQAKMEDYECYVEKHISKIEYYQHLIINYIANIMKCEDIIAQESVEVMNNRNKLSELKGKAAALEAEIINRKMIEAQEYISVSEEAFNISVQAEIDLANNVKAIENLKQAALSTAVMEVVPVMFAIERFNEGAEETAAAVIDTSITKVTDVPIVENDAYAEIEDEIKCKLEAIEGLKAEVEKLRKQLKDLKKILLKPYEQINDKFKETCADAQEKGVCIWIRTQGGEHSLTVESKFGDWNSLSSHPICFKGNLALIKIIFNFAEIAVYRDLATFKAAIEGLAAAIERGDTEFTFPADNAA